MGLQSLSTILVVMWLSCARFLWPFPWLESFNGATDLVFDFIVWGLVVALILVGIRTSFGMLRIITWALFRQLVLVSLFYFGFRLLFDSAVYIALLNGIWRGDITVMFHFYAKLSNLAKIDTIYFDFAIPFMLIISIGIYAKVLRGQNNSK